MVCIIILRPQKPDDPQYNAILHYNESIMNKSLFYLSNGTRLYPNMFDINKATSIEYYKINYDKTMRSGNDEVKYIEYEPNSSASGYKI